MSRRESPVMAEGGYKPATSSLARTAICERCSKMDRLFLVDGKRLCVSCFELNLGAEPRRAGADRRDADHDPRGFGRRFDDDLKSS